MSREPTRARLVPAPRRPALQDGVLRVARHIRERVQRFAREHKLVLGADEDLNPSLRGLCAIAAYGLMRALDDAGIHSVFEHGRWGRIGGHCWTFVPGAFDVVDVTATQYLWTRGRFGRLIEPVVALEQIAAPYRGGRYAGDEALELIEWMARDGGWDPRFIPQTYEHEGYWR